MESCSDRHVCDKIIVDGLLYDGSGKTPCRADLTICGDTICKFGSAGSLHGKEKINANGYAVAPGFINMLSWSTESLLRDPKSQSEIRQGVTLQVFGEGWSMGPLNDTMKKDRSGDMSNFLYDITWTTLGEYLEHLERRGVSPNIASFVGATTIRIYVLGYANRKPEAKEMEKMKELVREAMEEGALGVGSALIYAPGFYADTDELIGLCKVASEYGGMYVSHMRSEGNGLLEGIDELIGIAKEATIRAEIYHLKAAGKQNWDKLDKAIAKIDSARTAGLAISADMYTYSAAGTGLYATMPPWVQEGGQEAWEARLKDPVIRERVKMEMLTPSGDWENFFLSAGAEGIIFSGFKNDSLRHYIGKSLAEVAVTRNKTPVETAMDLVIEDKSPVDCIFFLMSEENVRKQIKLPWISFCSDGISQAPEGEFLKSNPHPRSYGNFARLLGKYVREEKIIPLEEAIRRLTSFPATNLKILKRGLLKEGYFADIVIFDPAKINDYATYVKPHRYAEGMIHVLVNGTQVLKDGNHTGATPGRFVKGPGWNKKSKMHSN